jgi:hypothetical protein
MLLRETVEVEKACLVSALGRVDDTLKLMWGTVLLGT